MGLIVPQNTLNEIFSKKKDCPTPGPLIVAPIKIKNMIPNLNIYQSVEADQVSIWFKAAPVTKFPANGGASKKY